MRSVLLILIAAGASLPVTAPAQTNPAFVQCAACHKVEAGKNGLGPSLSKIVGRKRASVPGFNYSPAMKAKGGVWSEAELNAYLTDPRTAIPGNRMAFIGIKDPVKRAATMTYLKTLK